MLEIIAIAMSMSIIVTTLTVARISGEMGTLCTVVLSIYSGTCLLIFIEIGSYLTDTEQKISWHFFIETRCIIQHMQNFHANISWKQLIRVVTVYIYLDMFY